MNARAGAGEVETHRSAALRQLGPLLMAYLRRDWKITISYKLGFALQLVQSVVSLGLVYFVGQLVGTQSLGKSPSLRLGYFPFGVLGVALLGVVNAELRTVSNQVRGDQTTGTLEAVLAMPPPPWLSVMGSTAFQLVYATVIALLTVLIAVVAFGMRFHCDVASLLFAVLGLVVSLPLFLGLGVAFAATVVVFKRGVTVFGFVGTGFMLFGGVYFPTSVIKQPVLHLLSDVLPFTWALNVIRAGLLEQRELWVQLGLLIAGSVVLVPLSLWLFTLAVQRARRSGTLGQY